MNCEHNKTTIVSLSTAYYIECLECGKQWNESQADGMEAELWLRRYYSGL